MVIISLSCFLFLSIIIRNIYNKLISKIVKNENIDVCNIYYKPHPRCQNISDKKKFLNCKILNNNNSNKKNVSIFIIVYYEL